MSRHESDREDLYEELKTCEQRWELRIASAPLFSVETSEPHSALSVSGNSRGNSSTHVTTVTAGVRRDGRLLLYFDSDPVFQFDEKGRLKRGFQAGELYRAQGDTLSRLTRQRSDHESTLIRHDLTPDELENFQAFTLCVIKTLQTNLKNETSSLLRSSGTPLAELERQLHQIISNQIAIAPAFKTRR